MTEAILNWTGTLAPASEELTDSEINDRYGSLLQRAVSAFRSDPSYVVEMAEVSAQVIQRREQRRRAS